MWMQLNEIVLTSARVVETSGRLARIGHLAACLRAVGAEAAEVAVGLLAGAPQQTLNLSAAPRGSARGSDRPGSPRDEHDPDRYQGR
jgi:hypothetical protein